MKNLTQKIILIFSLLGFVTLTACGQTENKQNQKKTVLSQEENPDNPFEGFNLADYADEVSVKEWNTWSLEKRANFAREKKVKTLTTPSDDLQTSTVSVGAEQADDDLFSINLSDKLKTQQATEIAASKARIAKKEIESNKLDKTGEALDIENTKLKAQLEAAKKQKGDKQEKKEK